MTVALAEGLGNDPTARILKRKSLFSAWSFFLGLGNDPTARILKRQSGAGGKDGQVV